MLFCKDLTAEAQDTTLGGTRPQTIVHETHFVSFSEVDCTGIGRKRRRVQRTVVHRLVRSRVHQAACYFFVAVALVAVAHVAVVFAGAFFAATFFGALVVTLSATSCLNVAPTVNPTARVAHIFQLGPG